MRREYFTLHTQVGDDAKPTISIEYDGPEDALQSALRDDAGEVLPGAALDVTCRLLDDGTEGACVLGLTHRLTGEFLLEVNGQAPAVLSLVDAARSNGDEDERYRVRVESADTSITYDKETLLVYDGEGNLLRGRSLIPSGVEL